MLRVRAEAMHRFTAEPCLQALDEPHPCFVLGARTPEQVDRAAMQRDEIRRLDPDRFDRLNEPAGGEAFAQQLQQALGFAAWRGKSDL